MAELYLRGAPDAWHAPSHHVARPHEPPFIVAANIIARWLYAFAVPFFWAAIVMMLVLGEVAPR